MSRYAAIETRMEWMRSENRFAVFVALLGVTAFIVGYEAWQAVSGAPVDSHLWAVPLICCNLVMMGLLAAKNE